eukprot:3475095-Rhodomonas_salina.3
MPVPLASAFATHSPTYPFATHRPVLTSAVGRYSLGRDPAQRRAAKEGKQKQRRAPQLRRRRSRTPLFLCARRRPRQLPRADRNPPAKAKPPFPCSVCCLTAAVVRSIPLDSGAGPRRSQAWRPVDLGVDPRQGAENAAESHASAPRPAGSSVDVRRRRVSERERVGRVEAVPDGRGARPR